MKKIIFLTLFISSFLFGSMQEYFPKPNNKAVIDDAGIISQEVENELNKEIIAYDKNSTNQIQVVTLKTLGGYEIEEFGVELARKLKIGQKEHNNGVLLLVAPNEKKVRIEVGYGLEGTLSDYVSKSIISKVILPFFKKGDYEGGISAGVAVIMQYLKKDNISFERKRTNSSSSLDMFVIFLFIVWVFFIMSKSKMSRTRTKDVEILRGRNLDDYFNSSYTRGSRYNTGIDLMDLMRSSHRSRRGGGFDDFGGGFSGGGGDFGGGGASGSW